MADAVLSRSGSGGESVTIPLLGESGNLSLSRDIGKPNLTVQAVGREAPRTQDFQNAQAVWTIAGVLIGANAYADAESIAEDLILPRLNSALTLDLSDLPNRSTYDVVPNGESACTLTYVPGRLNVVGVQLSLIEVETVNGGTQASVDPGTPPSGDGIRLTRGTNSVELTVDNALTRTVGRPGIELNPNTADRPIAIDQNSPASDVFELSGVFVENASATAKTLEEDILLPRLGGGSIRLAFLGETYGLGAYDVVPTGSQAGRTASNVARSGEVSVPKIELRAVDNS